jgi:hypothetical protein
MMTTTRRWRTMSWTMRTMSTLATTARSMPVMPIQLDPQSPGNRNPDSRFPRFPLFLDICCLRDACIPCASHKEHAACRLASRCE